ncbi:MAG: ABC transporter permease [Bacteroidia bacterium]
MQESNEHWDLIIKPQNKWYQIDLAAIWRYRDLLMLLVRRDFVSVYKQTILGPIWFFIQPILTTLTFTIIFGNLAKVSTDGIPPILFYTAGTILWNYFSECLTRTSGTFTANASVFGKVYFPRLVVPISVLISNLVKLAIQFVLFAIIWIYYYSQTNSINPNWTYLPLLPILILIMAGLGLGFGIFISSLTTKYRDFTFLISFGVQLMMYASPVVYPVSIIPEKYKFWILLNPVSSIIEAFKYIFIGQGYFSWNAIAYSTFFMFLLLMISVIIFNKVEKTFMDTV